MIIERASAELISEFLSNVSVIYRHISVFNWAQDMTRDLMIQAMEDLVRNGVKPDKIAVGSPKLDQDIYIYWVYVSPDWISVTPPDDKKAANIIKNIFKALCSRIIIYSEYNSPDVYIWINSRGTEYTGEYTGFFSPGGLRLKEQLITAPHDKLLKANLVARAIGDALRKSMAQWLSQNPEEYEAFVWLCRNFPSITSLPQIRDRLENEAANLASELEDHALPDGYQIEPKKFVWKGRVYASWPTAWDGIHAMPFWHVWRARGSIIQPRVYEPLWTPAVWRAFAQWWYREVMPEIVRVVTYVRRRA